MICTLNSANKNYSLSHWKQAIIQLIKKVIALGMPWLKTTMLRPESPPGL